MSFRLYESYRESGVRWLGSVPSGWTVKAIKHCFSVVGGSTPKSEVEEFWDGEHVWVTPADLSGLSGFGIVDSARRITDAGLESCGTNLVPPGSIVLSTRAPIGSLAIAGTSLCTNQGCKSLVPKQGVVPRYFAYVLSIAGEELNLRGRGTTFLELSADALGAFEVVVPTATEQVAIAAFLDRETAKIDALVEEQKRLIELLKEKRQAVISQAVTKGLDQSVPMKDSGVECLGEVPAHWQVRPLKKCIAFQEGPGIMAADFQDDGVPLLRISCVQSEAVTLAGCNYLDPDKVARQWSHFRVEIGDLLISGSASMGVVSEVGEEAEGAVPYTGLMRLQSRHGGMLKDFIKHLVVSDSFMRQVQLLKTGSTIQHFGPTHLNQMLVVLPPEDEQEAIATFLTSENRRMDSLRAEAEAGMALLEERRSALISAAVTGKIDVRGLVPQPEVISA